MPGTALWVDGFICLPVSPFICLPLSPSLDAWHGSLGGRVRLSPFVSLHVSPSLDAWRGSGSFVSLCLPSFVSRCLPAWMPGWTDSLVSLCLPSFVARCLPAWIWHGWTGSCVSLCPLHLSPVLSQPGCLARRVHLSAWMPGTALWVDGFICLPLSPSRCLPAWMPGAALWVDGFICLPLSPRMSGFPFICLPLSPSLDASVFLVDRFTFLPSFGCLSRLSRRTDSLVSLGSPSFVSHLCGWTDSFVSLCLPLFVSRCLPAWMPGTALWVDGFICLPLSPSLDVWHSRSAVSFTSRGSVLLAGSGLPSALALASVIPCLVDVGDRVLLCLPFIWTSLSLGLVVGRLPCLSLATPCLFVQCLVISCGPELTIAVRCGARLQLREGSVNPPVKQT